MLASLVASPATYFMALIVGLGAMLPGSAGRLLRIGPMGLLGLVMFLVSTGIITSYRHVPDEMQIVWWTTGLFVVGLLYSLILLWRVSERMFPLALFGVALTAYGFAMAADADLTRKAGWFTQYALICFGAFLCYLSVEKNNTVGQMIWAVLFIAEGIGAAQVFDCQFLHGPTPLTGSACEAVYNWAGAPFVPTVITALPLVWILYRWARADARR